MKHHYIISLFNNDILLKMITTLSNRIQTSINTVKSLMIHDNNSDIEKFKDCLRHIISSSKADKIFYSCSDDISLNFHHINNDNMNLKSYYIDIINDIHLSDYIRYKVYDYKTHIDYICSHVIYIIFECDSILKQIITDILKELL